MKKKKAFTLVEVVIVVVVIWLLVSAIAPKLLQWQMRARHTKRHADLRQIAWWVITYQEDNGWIVPSSSMLSVDAMITWLDKYLVPRYMTLMPLDSLYVPSSYLIWIYDYILQWLPAGEQPAGFWQTPWVSRQVKAPWSFGYIPLSLNGKPNTSFALIAAFIEEPEYANWIIYPNGGSARNILVYYGAGTYTQISSWAWLTLTTLTDAVEMKTALCKRINTSTAYTVPAHIWEADGSATCYPANNNPLAVYWYSTRDNYYRFIYIP
jgi:competence protein ComGC